MRKFVVLAAFAAALTAGPALAKEKPDQPRVKKVCRTVQMSGRITPQRICRKVERPAAEEGGQRTPRQPDPSGNTAD
ncbi:MAG TPA: hypothetical protein VF782_14030 [Allosphingosinicella sp.]|jgi:hypothetical protein